MYFPPHRPLNPKDLANKPERNPKQPETHHNSPQTRKTRVIHKEMVGPPLLTLIPRRRLRGHLCPLKTRPAAKARRLVELLTWLEAGPSSAATFQLSLSLSLWRNCACKKGVLWGWWTVFIPPIAKARWMEPPAVVMGWRRTGNSNSKGKCGGSSLRSE